METFLKLVATDLYDKTQGNLSKTAVVFPNKRAGLFFNEYLGGLLRPADLVAFVYQYQRVVSGTFTLKGRRPDKAGM